MYLMKIVFVEVHDWEKELLQKSFPDAQFTIEKLTTENVDLYKDAEIISCFIYSQIKQELLDKLSVLKFVATRSTGFDNIDITLCKQKNIVVSNVPEYGSNT